MDKCIRDFGGGDNGDETLMFTDNVADVTDTVTQIQDIAYRWYQRTTGKGMKMNTNKGKTELW